MSIQLVNAKIKSKLEAKSADIEIIVNEHLKKIQDRLHKHKTQSGANYIRYFIEYTKIDNLSKLDCQRIVYTKLIRKIEEASYSVRLKVDDIAGNEHNELIIMWRSSMDIEEQSKYDSFIESHVIAAEENLEKVVESIVGTGIAEKYEAVE